MGVDGCVNITRATEDAIEVLELSGGLCASVTDGVYTIYCVLLGEVEPRGGLAGNYLADLDRGVRDSSFFELGSKFFESRVEVLCAKGFYIVHMEWRIDVLSY